VASSLRLGTGEYLVTFNQDVTGCVYQATVGGPTTGVFAGQVTAAQRVNIAAGVRVITQTSAGVGTDLPFFLTVFC
jgi:hypothetical protein